MDINNPKKHDYGRKTININGNALAVWQQFDGTRFSILANRFE